VAPDKKGAQRLGAYLVFIDESGMMLTGTVCGTWAPRGHTPVVRSLYRHDKVSLISGITLSPKQHRVGLYYRVYQSNIRRPEVCEFLRDLLNHLQRHLVVLWDNGPIHKGDPIRAFLARHKRLHLENFPGYAPELNPDEGVWNSLKKSLANSSHRNKQELGKRVSSQLRRMQRSPGTLRACIYESELPIEL